MNIKQKLIAGAVVVVVVGFAAYALARSRRARPPAERTDDELLATSLAQPDLGPIVISAGPPLEIRGDFGITALPAPLNAFDEFSIAVGDAIGPVVDQIKDSLKGLGLWSRKVPERFRALFAMAGSQYRLPPGLLEAVAYRESRFREDIISGKVRSDAGAVGIMQIVPRWHPELGEKGALNPAQAIPYAAKYLRANFERFGNWKQALAAYNWGPTVLAKAIAAGRGDTWPAETTAYVREISANAGLA